MKRNLICSALLLIGLSSCEFKCNVGKTDDVNLKEKTGTTSSSSSTYTDGINQSQVMNDINIKATGDVKVYRAMLTDEAGNLVRDNTIPMGEPIYLSINLEEGWEVEDGKSFIGASQVITTDNGTELLNTGDLFSSYETTGLDATDSKIISLKARITEASGPIDHYVVNFRVWDKKGNGEIKGSYQFKTK